MIFRDVIIREIKKIDRKRCIEIINSCLMEINSRNYSPKFIKYLKKSYSKNYLRRPEIYTSIIEQNEMIIGTGSISAKGQIRDLFIDIKHHRKGYGKKLLVYLEDVAKSKNLKKSFLYSAISAVKFYKSQGYTQVDQLDHGDGNIEIKMEKNLN
jgi:citrate lyase synthetase